MGAQRQVGLWSVIVISHLGEGRGLDSRPDLVSRSLPPEAPDPPERLTGKPMPRSSNGESCLLKGFLEAVQSGMVSRVRWMIGR